MSRQIIGFTGLIGSGKSEAAKELYHRGFTRTRFAGPLKQMMRVVGLDDDEIEGSKKELPCEVLCGRTPRYAMQTIGTEWGRQIIGEDFWVRVWKHNVGRYPAHVNLTVEDVRFANEAEAVRSLGGIIVRVVRGESTSGATHQSEAQNFDADVLLCNNGTLNQFHERVRALIGIPAARSDKQAA